MNVQPKQLSVARAADREHMATVLQHIVQQTGATVERDTLMSRGREIWLHIHAPRGLGLTITLDGDNQQDRQGEFCMAWHILGPDACLSEAFGLTMRSTVNPHHRKKCTAFAHGFESLCLMLAQGLTMADDGTAFEPGQRATNAEIREELRNEVTNTGDC